MVNDWQTRLDKYGYLITFSAATAAALPRANRKAEGHFGKLNDEFGSTHSAACSLDPTARRLVLAASPAQQRPACRQQLTATHKCDHRLIRFCKDSK